MKSPGIPLHPTPHTPHPALTSKLYFCPGTYRGEEVNRALIRNQEIHV
ncbi:MAG: hypothetical protein F6K58_30985 [Symploca sp. SIO2E9]|nr:hypothetical protein [Symploca sp. SIO2E9]